MKEIYIMISQTHTGFARLIRKVKRIEYNHASIALDSDLDQLYAFARPKHKAVLLGRLVRENLTRYTLNKHTNVKVMIFKINITDEQYMEIKDMINKIKGSDEYLYNLFSVLTFPLTGGFATYKAFSCVEFIMYLLCRLNIKLDMPLYQYCPDDLIDLLSGFIYYKGNLLDYKTSETDKDDYFSSLSSKEIIQSIFSPFRLLYRLLFNRTKNYLY